MSKFYRCFFSFPLLLLLLFVGGEGVLQSCNDAEDREVLPPARFDLCEALTDDKGQVIEFRFDNGQILLPANNLPLLRPDTLYRMLLGYQVSTTGKAAVHHWDSILTIHARSFSPEKMRTDPVKIISVWQTRRYINLRLSVPRTAAKKHYFSFQTSSFYQPTDEQKARHLVLRLYHDADGDRPDYFEEALLSCPIYGYAGKLRAGVDSITMVVNTPTGEQKYSGIFR